MTNRKLIILIAILTALLAVFGLLAGILDAFSGSNGSETTGTESQTEAPIQTADTSETDGTTSSDVTTEPDETAPPIIDASAEASLSASQIFVYSLNDDRFIYERGTDKPILPASITKILTALYALDVMPADEVITIGNEIELVGKGSSLAFTNKEGFKLTLEMLVEGMLLPSGNDSAYAIAAGVARYVTGNKSMDGADAVSYFMDKANEYAKSLGCTGTFYTVPDGLAYEGHYTSAHDLVILAEEALKNDIICKYASTVRDKVYYVSGESMDWKNSNQLINPDSPYYRECVTGLKTGSLDNHYCLLVSADIGGDTYIIGVIGAPSVPARFTDATTIIDIIASQA